MNIICTERERERERERENETLKETEHRILLPHPHICRAGTVKTSMIIRLLLSLCNHSCL